MTRKRYIKLLMAEGYSRNLANAYAWTANLDGISYQQSYDKLMKEDKLYEMVMNTLGPSMKSIERVVKALTDGLSAFTTAFSEALKH